MHNSHSPRLFFFAPIIALVAVLFLLFATDANMIFFRTINGAFHCSHPAFWASITILGDSLVTAIVLLPFIRKKPEILWAVLCAALVATLINRTLKPFINAPRPPAVLSIEDICVIGRAYKHHSFPSGHTVTAFTVASVVMYLCRSRSVRAVACTAAVGAAFSRVVIGIHWPCDIVAGAIIGFGSGYVGVLLAQKFPLHRKIITQKILGAILLAAAVILVFFYDTHYPDAVIFQRVLGTVFLGWGALEYSHLWIRR